jgi:hypothetical protein
MLTAPTRRSACTLLGMARTCSHTVWEMQRFLGLMWRAVCPQASTRVRCCHSIQSRVGGIEGTCRVQS